MPPQARNQSGFSLVEVLMTVFVLAMVTGIVVVTLPRMTSPLMQEAKRFQAVAELGRQQARVGGLPLGLRVEEQTYGLSVWRDQRWEPVTETEYKVRRDIQLLNQSPQSEGERPEGWPAVVFDPLAGVDVSQFEMRQSRERIIIEINAEGDVELEQRRG